MFRYRLSLLYSIVDPDSLGDEESNVQKSVPLAVVAFEPALFVPVTPSQRPGSLRAVRKHRQKRRRKLTMLGLLPPEMPLARRCLALSPQRRHPPQTNSRMSPRVYLCSLGTRTPSTHTPFPSGRVRVISSSSTDPISSLSSTNSAAVHG